MTRTGSTICLILLFLVFSSSAKEEETEEDRLRRCWMLGYNMKFGVNDGDTFLLRCCGSDTGCGVMKKCCIQVRLYL